MNRGHGGVRSCRLLDADRVGHRAGQYVLLHARGSDVSVAKRACSIASPPDDTAGFALCCPPRAGRAGLRVRRRGSSA